MRSGAWRRRRSRTFPSPPRSELFSMYARTSWVQPSVLPGFGLAFGTAFAFVTLIVVIPIAALVLKAGSLPLAELWRIATEPRALATYRLSFGASLLAARSEEHTSELQSRENLVCRLLLEKKK